MHGLDNALAKNTERRQVHFGHSQNMAVLARQLQNVHTEKDRQISSVLTRVSLQEQAMLKANKYNSRSFSYCKRTRSCRSLAEKVKKLHEEINDRKLAFNALSAKNALLEADLTVSGQQHQDAQHEIKRIQIEKEQLINQIRREYKQEKDVS